MADPLPPGVTTPEQVDALPLPDTMKFAMKRYLSTKQQADLLGQQKQKLQSEIKGAPAPRLYERLPPAADDAALGLGMAAVPALGPAAPIVAGAMAGAHLGRKFRSNMAQPTGVPQQIQPPPMVTDHDPYETHVPPDYTNLNSGAADAARKADIETYGAHTAGVDADRARAESEAKGRAAYDQKGAGLSADRKASVLAHIAKTYHGSDDDITSHLPPITPLEEQTFKSKYPSEYQQMKEHLIRTSPMAKKIIGGVSSGGAEPDDGIHIGKVEAAKEEEPTPNSNLNFKPTHSKYDRAEMNGKQLHEFVDDTVSRGPDYKARDLSGEGGDQTREGTKVEPKPEVEKGLGTLPEMNKYNDNYTGGKDVDKLYRARANPKNKYGAI